MKWLFGITLLLNILLASWLLSQPKTTLTLKEIKTTQPEQLTLITPTTAKAMDEAPVISPVPAQNSSSEPKAQILETSAPIAETVAKSKTCYQWGTFTTEQTNKIKRELNYFKLSDQHYQIQSQSITKVGQSNRNWVYLPVQNDIERKSQVQALQAAGFDSFEIKTPVELKGNLSLGLFKQKEMAEAFLVKLKLAGFAKATLQSDQASTSDNKQHFIFQLDTPNLEKRLQQVQNRLYPGIALQKINCPNT